MNLKNNFQTYSGLDRIAKKAPAQELLDKYEDTIRDLRYYAVSEKTLTGLGDNDILLLLTAARLALQDSLSHRASMLQCSIIVDTRVDTSIRKDYRRIKGQLALLKAEASKRAEIAAKKARTFRAALKD